MSAIPLGDMYFQIVNRIDATKRSCDETERIINEMRARVSQPISIPVQIGGANAPAGAGGGGGGGPNFSTNNNFAGSQFSQNFSQAFTQNLTQNLQQNLTQQLTMSMAQQVNAAIDNSVNNVINIVNRSAPNAANNLARGLRAGLMVSLASHIAGTILNFATDSLETGRAMAASGGDPQLQENAVMASRAAGEKAANAVPFGIGSLAVAGRDFFDASFGNGKADVQREDDRNKSEERANDEILQQARRRDLELSISNSPADKRQLLELDASESERLAKSQSPFNKLREGATSLRDSKLGDITERRESLGDFASGSDLNKFQAERDTADRVLKEQLATIDKRAAKAKDDEKAVIDAERDNIKFSMARNSDAQGASLNAMRATAGGNTFLAMREMVAAENESKLSKASPDDRKRVEGENKARSEIVEREIHVAESKLDVQQNDLHTAGEQSGLIADHKQIEARRLKLSQEVYDAEAELKVAKTEELGVARQKVETAKQELAAFNKTAAEEKELASMGHAGFMAAHVARMRGDDEGASIAKIDAEEQKRLKTFDPSKESSDDIKAEAQAQRDEVKRQHELRMEQLDITSTDQKILLDAGNKFKKGDFSGAATEKAEAGIITGFNRSVADINNTGNADEKIAKQDILIDGLKLQKQTIEQHLTGGTATDRDVFSAKAEGVENRNQANLGKVIEELNTLIKKAMSSRGGVMQLIKQA